MFLVYRIQKLLIERHLPHSIMMASTNSETLDQIFPTSSLHMRDDRVAHLILGGLIMFSKHANWAHPNFWNAMFQRH